MNKDDGSFCIYCGPTRCTCNGKGKKLRTIIVNWLKKPRDLEEIVTDFYGKPATELTKEILEWQSKELEPLKKAWDNLSTNDKIYLPTKINESIKQLLGEK